RLKPQTAAHAAAPRLILARLGTDAPPTSGSALRVSPLSDHWGLNLSGLSRALPLAPRYSRGYASAGAPGARPRQPRAAPTLPPHNYLRECQWKRSNHNDDHATNGPRPMTWACGCRTGIVRSSSWSTTTGFSTAGKSNG